MAWYKAWEATDLGVRSFSHGHRKLGYWGAIEQVMVNIDLGVLRIWMGLVVLGVYFGTLCSLSVMASLFVELRRWHGVILYLGEAEADMCSKGASVLGLCRFSIDVFRLSGVFFPPPVLRGVLL